VDEAERAREADRARQRAALEDAQRALARLREHRAEVLAVFATAAVVFIGLGAGLALLIERACS